MERSIASQSGVTAGQAAAPLRGGWLVVTRIAWVALAALVLVVFVANLPAEYAGLQRVCTAVCAGDDLTPERAREIAALGFSVQFFAGLFLSAEIVFAAIWFVVGLAIFWRRSADRAALFVALFLVVFGAAVFLPPAAARAAGTLAWWPIALIMLLGSACLHLFFFLFPDGRFVPRWSAPLAPALPLLGGAALIFPNVAPLRWLSPFQLGPFLALVLAGIGAQIYRYRRVSGPSQRQQTRLVVFSAAGAMVVVTLAQLLPRLFDFSGALAILATVAITYLALLLIPLAIGLAILRYRLWEIRLLVNRTLVYAALTACVIGLYALVVGGLGALLQGRANALVALLATGLVAVLFQPLRERLQRGVNRLVYGERDDPYAVISRLGQRLEATLPPEAVLPTIVETVAQALRLPYAEIALRASSEFTALSAEFDVSETQNSEPNTQNFAVVASFGQEQARSPSARLISLPLAHRGELVGELRLAPRAGESGFRAADRRLLDALAIQAGAAAHGVRLTADLQRLTAELQQSRERLIGAREEERRRLRRDLHDGVGPTLASLAQRIDTARRLVPRDPDAAAAMLDQLRGQVKSTIADIRRLVYALRPPVLDELGLLSAIREHAIGHIQAEGLRVVVDAPAELPPLPAAVEVAAYRIALEALTNVTRHAGASACVVRLAIEDGRALVLEVSDDGAGLGAGARSGVGIASMRERAAELGGELRIEPAEMGGTRVYVRLPLGI